MTDYSKTLIYKLINYDNPDLIYVGSTTNFTKRKQQHKARCYNENQKKYNFKIYLSIRENGGWENWNMIKICDYPCYNRREAEQEEDKYMIELKSNLHMRRAFRSSNHYRENNKDKRREINQKYYENNKVKIKQIQDQYREDNKEIIKDRKLKYYEGNKEKINEKEKCLCGCEVNKRHLKRHQTTKKHIDLMNNQSL
jgi:hypothetical protein